MPESNNKYYMSVDGGGSKLSVILFDEEHKIVGRGYSGAINPRFVSDRMIRRNFETGIVDCLKYTGVTHIEKLYIAMPGPVDLFAYMLSKRVKLNQYHYMSEGKTACLAAYSRGTVSSPCPEPVRVSFMSAVRMARTWEDGAVCLMMKGAAIRSAGQP